MVEVAVVNENNSSQFDNGIYQGQESTAVNLAKTENAPAPTPPSNFNGSLNVFAMLAQALANNSNVEMALAVVQSNGLNQDANIESVLSAALEAACNSINNKMQGIISNGGVWTMNGKVYIQPNTKSQKPGNGANFYGMSKQQTTSEMQLLNSQFSEITQEGNMNMQVVQGSMQSGQTESQLTLKAIEAMSSMFGQISSFTQFLANQISK